MFGDGPIEKCDRLVISDWDKFPNVTIPDVLMLLQINFSRTERLPVTLLREPTRPVWLFSFLNFRSHFVILEAS